VVSFGIPGSMGIVTVNSVSLVPGSIPTIPAPQTPTEVLNECRYYWEQTYNIGVVAGTISTDGMVLFDMAILRTTSQVTMHRLSFSFAHTKKVSAPAVIFYSPTVGTIDRVDYTLYSNGALVTSMGGGTVNPSIQDTSVGTGLYTLSYQSLERGYMLSASTTSELMYKISTLPYDVEGQIRYHATYNSRLGT